ncbi:MAG TPA: GspE/PulE family protein [Candidatus Saccharimonadales bacterium]|nr:GspE/PulE family protein [Candidatus Saccharimonadales bacterium]
MKNIDIDTSLLDFLRKSGIVEAQSLQESYSLAKQSGQTLAKVISDQGLVDDVILGQIVADLYKLPFVQLSQISLPLDVLQIVPEDFAQKHKLIAFAKNGTKLKVATSSPLQEPATIDWIKQKSNLPIELYYATDNDIVDALLNYLGNLLTELATSIAQAEVRPSDARPNIIELVDLLILYAYRSKASDIHIEPSENSTLIRFRVDGILHDVTTISANLFDQVITRIKVISNLKIDEHFSPQDGSIPFLADEKQIDIRVSIVPTTRGENIVLRLLSENIHELSIHELGISAANLQKIKSAYSKSRGMLLASGPTGCGKTTTMYAILKLINKPELNIMTIEDPVEYQIERIRQIQVNPAAGLTFAKGLRSIIRQDPNVILVGEVRDQETADIAINAALTGHLVMSTFHTNDAATVPARMSEMGVEAYLVASALNSIVAQRLVRSLCRNCRVTHEITADEKKEIEKYFGSSISELSAYKGKGCSVCFNTGYRGRTGIFEVLETNKEIRKAITDKKDTQVIRDLAIKNGMQPLIEDGLNKVRQGITSLDEILGIIKEVM